VLAAFDRHEKDPTGAGAALTAALGEPRAGGVRTFAAALGDPAPLLARESAAPLRECLAHLKAMGLRDFVDVDFRIVRGLAYYTGIVFELFDAGRSLRAICGGGRYDDLLRQLGGVDLPCVGFGMGDVVLGELIADRDGPPVAEPPVDVFVAAATAEDRAPVLALAHALRERGLRVEYGLKQQALGKQLELAGARGARWAVVVGPDERAAGVAVVRDLQQGTEQRVALDALRTSYAFGEAE
jgi:histidyl-tRNA synthetase